MAAASSKRRLRMLWSGGGAAAVSRGECCCMMDSVHQDCCGDAWCCVKFTSAKLKMILALRLVLPWMLPWILPWMLLGGTLNLQPITGDDDLYWYITSACSQLSVLQCCSAAVCLQWGLVITGSSPQCQAQCQGHHIFPPPPPPRETGECCTARSGAVRALLSNFDIDVHNCLLVISPIWRLWI